jgi:hypothetical protein
MSETGYFRSFSVPKAFGTSEVFASLLSYRSWTIGKEIRSNTPSPAITFQLINEIRNGRNTENQERDYIDNEAGMWTAEA